MKSPSRVHLIGYSANRPVNAFAWGLGIQADRKESDPGLDHEQSAQLKENLKAAFTLSAADSADLFVHPHAFSSSADIAPFDAEARRLRRPCYFFDESDNLSPLKTEWGTVFRTSAYKSRLGPRERIMPYLGSDPMPEIRRDAELCNKHESFAVTPSEAHPSLGFCGFVSTPLRRALFYLTGRTQKATGLSLRSRILHQLQRSYPRDRLRFIFRTHYRAGLQGDVHAVGGTSLRNEYLENLIGSDYSLCMRGKGNFSTRLYEVLACGRIPIFVSADEGLPFEDTIDWSQHLLRIDSSDLPRLQELILKFHRETSVEKRQQMQAGNRRLWLEKLCPAAFFLPLVTIS